MNFFIKSPLLRTLVLASMMTGAAVCSAQEDVVTTESNESIVVIEVEEGRRVHLLCKGEAGEKTWIFVNAPELAPDITFVRPNDEYCQAKGGLLFPLTADSSEMYFSESLREPRLDLGVIDTAGYGPLAVTTAAGESPDDVDVIQTIVLLPRSLEGGLYLEEEPLIDPGTLDDEETRHEIAHREEGSRRAYVGHDTVGTIQGIYLHCYDSGDKVYSGYLNFYEAVSLGNKFLAFRELPGSLEEAPGAPEEVSAFETGGIENRACVYTETENIRIGVCNSSIYYALRVFVDGDYRVTLYKPCNKCPRFDFSTAISHAQSLVSALQGWEG